MTGHSHDAGKWEYLPLRPPPTGSELDSLENMLDEAGANGWELVSTTLGVDRVLIFKRRIYPVPA